MRERHLYIFFFSARQWTVDFENNFTSFAMLHVNILMKKFIWECRNGKIIPTEERCLSYIINKIRFFFSISKKFRKGWEKSEINIVF